MPLAKVDATDPACADLATRFDIASYPQLKLFIDGQPLDYAYGNDADSIVEHLRRHSSFGLPKVHSAAELEALATTATTPLVLGLFRMPIAASKAFQTFRSVAFALAGQEVSFAFAASYGEPPVMPLSADGKKPPVPGLVLVDGTGKLAARGLPMPSKKGEFTDSYIESWLQLIGVDVVLPDPPEEEEPQTQYDAEEEEDGRYAHEERLMQEDMEDEAAGEADEPWEHDDPQSLIPD